MALTLLTNKDTVRAIAMDKMCRALGNHAGTDPQLGVAIAKSMGLGDEKGYVMTAQQLIKCRLPGATREQAAEHIAQTLESSGTPYLTSSNTVFRDPVTGVAVLKRVFLPRRSLQHIFSVSQNTFAAAYRDMVFELNDILVSTLETIQEYKENKAEAHRERSLAHKETQNFVQQGGFVNPRVKADGTFVSPVKQASAKTAAMYVDYYTASIHPTKRARAAALDVGVVMSKKPIIHQTTDVCMEGFKFFSAKVRRKMDLAQQAGVPMTLDQAQRQVAAEDKARGTYIQQDLHGNDYGQDDQVRAQTDDAFAATGVPSSSLLALPAPM